MYLGLRTDAPLAEMYLYEGTTLIAEKTWQADRELAHGLLAQLESFLTAQDAIFTGLKGLFIYSGPGSFTGLRIGITTVNTMAYALNIAVIGSGGDDWRELAVARLEGGESDRIVLPKYGADARITKPKK